MMHISYYIHPEKYIFLIFNFRKSTPVRSNSVIDRLPKQAFHKWHENNQVQEPSHSTSSTISPLRMSTLTLIFFLSRMWYLNSFHHWFSLAVLTGITWCLRSSAPTFHDCVYSSWICMAASSRTEISWYALEGSYLITYVKIFYKWHLGDCKITAFLQRME